MMRAAVVRGARAAATEVRLGVRSWLLGFGLRPLPEHGMWPDDRRLMRVLVEAKCCSGRFNVPRVAVFGLVRDARCFACGAERPALMQAWHEPTMRAFLKARGDAE